MSFVVGLTMTHPNTFPQFPNTTTVVPYLKVCCHHHGPVDLVYTLVCTQPVWGWFLVITRRDRVQMPIAEVIVNSPCKYMLDAMKHVCQPGGHPRTYKFVSYYLIEQSSDYLFEKSCTWHIHTRHHGIHIHKNHRTWKYNGTKYLPPFLIVWFQKCFCITVITPAPPPPPPHYMETVSKSKITCYLIKGKSVTLYQ